MCRDQSVSRMTTYFHRRQEARSCVLLETCQEVHAHVYNIQTAIRTWPACIEVQVGQCMHSDCAKSREMMLLIVKFQPVVNSHCTSTMQRLQAPVEVRTRHRGVGTTAWNAPVMSKSEKPGPGSEILLVTLQRWGQISTSKCYWRCRDRRTMFSTPERNLQPKIQRFRPWKFRTELKYPDQTNINNLANQNIFQEVKKYIRLQSNYHFPYEHPLCPVISKISILSKFPH